MELLTEYRITEVHEFDQICESLSNYDISRLSEGDLLLLELDVKANYTKAVEAVKSKVASGMKKLQNTFNSTKAFLRDAFKDAKTAAKKVEIKNKLGDAKTKFVNGSKKLRTWGADQIRKLGSKMKGAMSGLKTRAANAASKGKMQTGIQNRARALAKSTKSGLKTVGKAALK